MTRAMNTITEKPDWGRKWKADKITSTGLVRVFDAGVVKSDTAIPKHLQHDLKRAAAKFEDIPEKDKDFHPGSDQMVINLVHPSLFPVIFGRTRVLPDKVLSLDDCLTKVKYFRNPRRSGQSGSEQEEDLGDDEEDLCIDTQVTQDLGSVMCREVMTMQEAKAERLALMKERSLVSDMGNVNFEVGSFNLCEH
ncbi:hypothetical protein N7492_000693 [Penicillium capsulatum]|uniref:DUF4246 domain-containing protein n=1 Tax=Penicillium capsulatum TaxID=69766 RepID=A0A9W9IS82_9EURO|nr:hypothetical protein N7492_000693 [Penicillium capsulatum]KAJ6130249.1 hypothetical protein N7512_003029 [Penicillium capsulatum]